MSQPDGNPKEHQHQSPATPSQEFAAYCEAEFERRQNSGADFDEHLYRKAMALVMDKLANLEGEVRS